MHSSKSGRDKRNALAKKAVKMLDDPVPVRDPG